MSWFSSGSKYKYRAQEALASAQALEEQQSDIEFRRSLLANIRQERLARAVLESGNYSDEFTSSSAAGATANIDSSLAGETLYSYDTSKRMQQIQGYQQTAQENYKKYQKQQQKRATAFSLTGIAAGALTGGAFALAGGMGAGAASSISLASIGKGMYLGARIGQGIGQIASGTGQTEIGIKNLIGGIGNGMDMYSADKYRDEMKGLFESMLNDTSVESSYLGGSTPYGRYLASSVIGDKVDYQNSESFMLPQVNGSNIKAVKGCY